MQIYRQLAALPATPTVATIGNFDGVHMGHQGVIAEVISRARDLSARSLVITFEPHPARVLRPDQPHPLITPLTRKLELLAATGIDATLVLPFTDELRLMSARAFATEVLSHAVRAIEVHEGENFRFGHRAEASVSDSTQSPVSGSAQGAPSLESLGRELGFAVRVYAPRSVRGDIVSSSRIRALIASGDVSHARVLLGTPFAVDSFPASGRGFGTRYAVPTINLAPYDELLPAHGVYITTLDIGEGEQSETFQAVTNVGIRPTFGPDSFAVESHLLNFHPIPLTAEAPIRLSFLLHLRPEQRFPNPALLLAQIKRDVAQAQRYFALRQEKQAGTGWSDPQI